MWLTFWTECANEQDKELQAKVALRIAGMCHLQMPRKEGDREDFQHSPSAYDALQGSFTTPYAPRTLDEVLVVALETYPLGETGGLAAHRFNFEVGGKVFVGDEWLVILKINKTGDAISSLTTTPRRYFYGNKYKADIESVKDYQAPKPEETTAVKAASKLSRMCNYPGDGFKHMMFGLKAFIPATLLLVASAAGQVVPTSSPDQARDVVFQIGTFDRSSVEFASGTPKQEVKFVVGQSSSTKDWYAIQPAILGSSANAKSTDVGGAPRTVTFSIEALASAYRLHLSLLIETASVPALLVDVNGKKGLFYPRPKLDYNNGDQTDSFYPAYSHADLEFVLPAGSLRQGKNSIAFQAVEQADDEVPDAGLTYDAIELDRGRGDADIHASHAQIEPTVFFQRQSGELCEEVDAFLRFDEPFKAGTRAELTVGGKKFSKSLDTNYDFGELKLAFLVPEFSAKAPARLTWTVNEHREEVEQAIDPRKKWTIFLVPHIHVDVGYSDYQAKVAAIQARSIHEALDMNAEHPDYRFSLDGEWDLEQFMRTRTPEEQQRAISAIQKEHIYVPAQYANLLTGFPTAEALIRSLYPSAGFSRIHGTPFNYANITDVPSYSWSYASILAAAGIHYLAGGSNNYRAPVLLQGRLNEASPTWWVGPDGGKVLLWYSRIYQQMQMLFGLPPVVPAGRDTFPLFLQMYQHPDYHADATILYGSQVENTDLFPQQAELVNQWNSIYAYPHMQYSGFRDALENIRNQFGDHIPTIRGDGGPYWEDGIGSDAYYAAMERGNEGRAPTAEKLATLSSLVNPQLKPDGESLAEMWKNIVLMDEHTWDSYNSTSDPASQQAIQQLAIKDQYAVNAAALVDFLAKNNMASLANSIPAATGSLIVFNTLNWKRSAPVIVDIDKGREIVDASTGKIVPFEHLGAGDNFQHVRFEAQDVPAMGYKVFEVRPESATAAAESKQTTTLESPFYRVELDIAAGALKSIFDKQLQRELINQKSPYRFGQYLYVSGGDTAPNSILQYSRVYPKPELSIHAAEGGSLVSIERAPEGIVARIQSHAEKTPKIATEIRLFDKEKKIELIEALDKTAEYKREAAYFAFPFAMEQPQFNYEVQNGVVNPAEDMYPGAGHEWFSVQHWVSVQQGGVSGTVMPLDAALVTLGDINRGDWPEHFGKRSGTVFSYIMNNYWNTNYRAAQGGHFQFRYVITSDATTNAPAISHMGWEEMTPLEIDTVTSQDRAISPPVNALPVQDVNHPAEPQSAGPSSPRTLDSKLGGFIDAVDPELLLETWKAAENGNGTILRFLDLGGAERTVTVQVPLINLKQAIQTDAVERDQAPLATTGDHGFKFTISKNQIVTVRIVGTPLAQESKP